MTSDAAVSSDVQQADAAMRDSAAVDAGMASVDAMADADARVIDAAIANADAESIDAALWEEDAGAPDTNSWLRG